MTQPRHASRQDILDIIQRHQEVAAQLRREQASPATSLSRAAPTVTAQSLPQVAPATPTLASTLPDIEGYLTRFLDQYLPSLISGAQPVTASIQELFTPPFHVSELWTAATAVRTLGDNLTAMVSEAVAIGAPAIQNLDAEALVDALVQFLLHRYLSAYVPAWAYTTVEAAILGGVKLVYETQIRPRFKGPRN